MIGHLFIPNDGWQEDEEGRLNAQIYWNGQHLHATALPIRDPDPTKEDEQHVSYMGATEFIENYIEDLMHGYGAGEPFEPTLINGKRFLVFLCPHSE